MSAFFASTESGCARRQRIATVVQTDSTLSKAQRRLAIVKQRYVLWIGLLLYAASFFLIAVVGRGPARGYICAYAALSFPWGGNLFGPLGIFENKLLEYVAVLISGWVNLVFLIATMIAVRGRSPRMLVALRTAVILMIPFCWVVFRYQDLYAREGHFVWILGMLLTLFSGEIKRTLFGVNERGE